MYFTADDYNVFTAANSSDTSDEMKKRRSALRGKLLDIHDGVYPYLNGKYGLCCHHARGSITTKYIQRMAKHYNTWLLVRYGISGDKLLGNPVMQYGIFEDKNFAVEFFLGREGDEVRKNLGKIIAEKGKLIEREIEKLKGLGFKWEAGGNIFDIDTQPTENFCDWLLKHNEKGESFLSVSYDPQDERISDFEKIKKEVTEKIEIMMPVYDIFTK